MNDLKFAFRQLRKNPGFTAAAVLTLALGIGANTALFSVVNGVLLRPLSFQEQDRLVTLWESNPARGVEQQNVSPPNLADWQTQSSTLEEMAFWTGPSDFNLVAKDGPEKVRESYASSGLFRVLRVEPQLGRGFLPEEDREKGPPAAVLSHELWQERFGGDPQVIGRSLTVDTFGRRTYNIVGVMPPGFVDLWQAYIRAYEHLGCDPFIGRRLVALLRDAGAEPRRNHWIFFGSCAGAPEFPAFVRNAIGVIETAREVITGPLGFGTKQFDRALRAMRHWGRRSDAVLWYALCWAEGVRGRS